MADVAPDVSLRGVSKSYGSVLAVDNVDFSIPRATILSLLGPSGCGKTTTLRLIAGFELPSKGDVYIRGARVTATPPYKRDFSMVFQSYALFPHLTVAENVAFGLRMRKVPRGDRARAVDEALGLVKLRGLEDRYPRQLSGGQQQRVALARAIVVRPAVLLLDEPLGALDKLLREEMQVELRELQQRLAITAVFVTHDQEEALTISDTVAVMRNGVIEQMGAPRALYDRPKTSFVASFLGASNFLEGRIAGAEGPARLVEIAGHRVKVTGDESGIGEGPVRLAIRPERIVIDAPGGGGLPARVANVVYRGPVTQFYLEGPAGAVMVYQQNALQGAASWSAGDTVTFRWDDGSGVILPAGP